MRTDLIDPSCSRSAKHPELICDYFWQVAFIRGEQRSSVAAAAFLDVYPRWVLGSTPAEGMETNFRFVGLPHLMRTLRYEALNKRVPIKPSSQN